MSSSIPGAFVPAGPVRVVAFHAYRNGAFQATTTPLPLPFDNTELNVGSSYNTISGAYTVPVTGLYLFGASVSYALTTGQSVQAELGVGGVSVKRFGHIAAPNNGNFTCGGAVMLACTAGQAVTCRMAASATVNGNAGSALAFFWGTMLSRSSP